MDDEDLDLEEYEFDIIYDTSKSVWVSTLINGNYLVNVKSPGFKEVNQLLQIRPGIKDFQIKMVPLSKSRQSIFVQAVDIQSGNPIKGVFFEMWRESA